ncbi:hypothetical protein [Verminephrobacter eiseniae]|uniref:hypothetical protein n=1 Tax=Verminephrobacter eiseniae TaxID=364317 RepID=UPI00223902BB|nr:hypothetical protein [Verminephrobacter eiseniae]
MKSTTPKLTLDDKVATGAAGWRAREKLSAMSKRTLELTWGQGRLEERLAHRKCLLELEGKRTKVAT